VFADTHGGAVHLFERDCSVQVARNSGAILPRFCRDSAAILAQLGALLSDASHPPPRRCSGATKK